MNDKINYIPVKDVYIAVSNDDKDIWNVYVINKSEQPITNVIIATKGYGEINGESKKTSVLRHMVERVEKNTYELVEPIDPALFQLTNEFWVSFYIGRQIYDKKYVFTPASFLKDNMINLPLINKNGILHN